MPGRRILPFGLGIAVAIWCLGALALTAVSSAAVEVPFATQFASSGHGGVTIAANTLMTCPASGVTELACLESREGKAPTQTSTLLNNNNYLMEREDADSDPATFDSSTATLTLPPGATVTFAGLYYGARTTKEGASAEAAPNPSARGEVLMLSPGGLTYTPLTASVNDSVGIKNAYTGFIDVTAQVAAAGAGQYTIANVQSGTGKDRYAGWSLVVAYSDPASPPRSIRVFGGLASIVASEAPLQIPITGLETPPAGTVATEVGVVAYEGDRGSSGDQLLLDGKNLTDAANPPNNIFNSSISIHGADVTSKDPNYVNQLGFDADLIGADGFLPNDATEAVLKESTNVEQYLTQAVAVSVELDPEALEPPPVEPPPPTEPPPVGPPPPPVTPEPPVTSAPTPHAPETPAEHGKKKHEHEAGGGKGAPEPAPETEPATAELTVTAPQAIVRPTAVVPLRVTVESTGGEPVRGLEVCNRLSDGLTRLRSPGATVHGAVACWHLPRLAAGGKRTFLTTARVDARGRRTLSSTTVVRAKNTKGRVRHTTLRVVPLPPRACGSSARLPGTRLARRC